MISIKNITSVSQITILPNSLIVLDIDDTILAFEGINDDWWYHRINYYMKKLYDYKTADKMALNDWIDYIKVNKPKLLDEVNFLEFIKNAREINCEIILLTARKTHFREMTYQHIKDLDIDIESDKIYFNEDKGEELFNILQQKYQHTKKIYFIDDNKKNIENVFNKFINLDYSIELFKIYHYSKK